MDFDTITLTREVACPPDRLFHLMTDREARQVWGAPDDRTVMRIDHHDLRPGGREVSVCGPKDNPEFAVTADFHVVDAPRLLIMSETMEFGQGPASISLVTQEVAERPEGGSVLTVTVQVASLIGEPMIDGYREGWGGSLANLIRLAEAGVPA